MPPFCLLMRLINPPGTKTQKGAQPFPQEKDSAPVIPAPQVRERDQRPPLKAFRTVSRLVRLSETPVWATFSVAPAAAVVSSV